MEKINDGGPAFPRPLVGDSNAGTVDFGAEGMSLRDYFAASISDREIDDKFPCRISDCEEYLGIKAGSYDYKIHYFKIIAKLRYSFADAMLAEREKTNEKK